MTSFVVFDPVTGQILMSGDVPEKCVSLQGTNVLAAAGSSETQYVDVETLTVVDKPPRPSDQWDWDYASKQWVLNESKLLRSIREQRNRLLQASDWTQLPDTPVADKAAWEAYRQALRDVTNQPDLEHIVWPTPPM